MEFWLKQGRELLDEIENTVTAPGEIALWFLGQCGFAFRSGSQTILVDPVLNDIVASDGTTKRNYPRPFAPKDIHADFVLCTHGHRDHMAGETLRGLNRGNTHFIIPGGCRCMALEFGIMPEKLILLRDGESAALSDSVIVTGISAAHPTHIFTDTPCMALGYSLVMNGVHVLHLGDTFLTPKLLSSLEHLDTPDLFLPPINGDDAFRRARNCIGNMEAEEAAKLAALLGARLSIPTHYDMMQRNTADPLRFAAELRRISPTACWKIPVLGERVILKKN